MYPYNVLDLDTMYQVQAQCIGNFKYNISGLGIQYIKYTYMYNVSGTHTKYQVQVQCNAYTYIVSGTYTMYLVKSYNVSSTHICTMYNFHIQCIRYKHNVLHTHTCRLYQIHIQYARYTYNVSVLVTYTHTMYHVCGIYYWYMYKQCTHM